MTEPEADLNGNQNTNRVLTPSTMSSSDDGPNAWSTPGSAAFDFRSASPPQQIPQPTLSTPLPVPFPFSSQRRVTKSQQLIYTGDTVTCPTASMLLATQNCTLQDDVFQEDPTTNSLESYMAEMTGKEAGLFVMSGTMGNQLSVRTALGGPPHSVLADARSHVIGW